MSRLSRVMVKERMSEVAEGAVQAFLEIPGSQPKSLLMLKDMIVDEIYALFSELDEGDVSDVPIEVGEPEG